jgi:hypothetical protein
VVVEWLHHAAEAPSDLVSAAQVQAKSKGLLSVETLQLKESRVPLGATTMSGRS